MTRPFWVTVILEEHASKARGPCSQMQLVLRDQRCVVIGAGPAGSLAAIALAKQGFRVDVYEKRPEPKLDHVSTIPSQVLTLISFSSHAMLVDGDPRCRLTCDAAM